MNYPPSKNCSEDQKLLAALVKKHGVADVLEGVKTVIKDGEKAIRDDHDQTLGNAFDYLVGALAEFYEKLPKEQKSLARLVLTTKPVMKSFEIRKADSPIQSQSVREAYSLAKGFVNKLVD